MHKISNLGQIIEFKGLLLGIYNIPNLFKTEYVGVIFWQNNTVTKIKQDLWERKNSALMYDDLEMEAFNKVIVYNYYDV